MTLLRCSQQEASQVIDDLRTAGLADDDQRATIQLTLNRRGRRKAQEIQQSRVSGIDRQDAVQGELLRWLSTRSGRASLDEYFTDDGGSAFGVDFELDELEAAAQYLKTLGHVDYLGSSGKEILLLWLTPQGRRAAADGRPVSEQTGGLTGTFYNDHSIQTNITNSTVAGVQVGGSGNSQTAKLTMPSDTAQKLIADLDELRERLDREGVDSIHPVRNELAKLEAEARGPRRLEALKDGARRTLGVVSDLATVAAPFLTVLLPLL